MGEKKVKKLTVAEINGVRNSLLLRSMERNAWRVSEEVVSRIDGDPG